MAELNFGVAAVENELWVDAELITGCCTTELVFSPLGATVVAISAVDPLVLMTSVVEVNVELLDAGTNDVLLAVTPLVGVGAG